MTKNDLAFFIVVSSTLILLVLYFTYPLAIPTQQESPLVQHQEAKAIQYSQPPAVEDKANPNVGAQQQRIDKHSSELIKSTPIKAIVRFYTKPSARNMKFLTAYINGIPTEMIFDTGASLINVNSQTMSQLRIVSPVIRSISSTAGGLQDICNTENH